MDYDDKNNELRTRLPTVFITGSAEGWDFQFFSDKGFISVYSTTSRVNFRFKDPSNILFSFLYVPKIVLYVSAFGNPAVTIWQPTAIS